MNLPARIAGLPRSARAAFAAAVLAVSGAVWLLVGPIAQPPAYHDFADQRLLLGIPHFWNVVSNGLLLPVGLAGLAAVAAGFRVRPARLGGRGAAALWGLFFAAICLTAAGSAYYHLAPDTARLFWDRLPLGLAAACLPAALLWERTKQGATGRLLLACWLALGPLSVVYWQVGEMGGAGDLRLYGLVQFGAMVAVAVLLLACRPRFGGSGYWWGALGCYGLAKICELADGAIFALGGLLSGHSLKHALAALAVALLGHMLHWRRPLP